MNLPIHLYSTAGTEGPYSSLWSRWYNFYMLNLKCGLVVFAPCLMDLYYDLLFKLTSLRDITAGHGPYIACVTWHGYGTYEHSQNILNDIRRQEATRMAELVFCYLLILISFISIDGSLHTVHLFLLFIDFLRDVSASVCIGRHVGCAIAGYKYGPCEQMWLWYHMITCDFKFIFVPVSILCL